MILHFLLAKANGTPLRCNTTVNGDNIYSIKSLKAGKYLKVDWKDGARTLSFTGNINDCGTCELTS